MQASIVFFCVLSWLIGADSRLQTPENAALQAHQQKQLEKAAKLLSLLKNRPRRRRERWSHWNAERTRIAYLAARIALRRKHPQEAINWLSPIVKKPSQIRDYIAFTLAESYQKTGHPQKAIKLYRYILKEFGRHWRHIVRKRLTIALQNAKQWKALGDHLKKLLWYPRPYGGRKKVLWQMVEAYLKAKQYKQMKRWLRHFQLRYPMSQEAKKARRWLTRIQKEQPTFKYKTLNEDEQRWRLYNLSIFKPKVAIKRCLKRIQSIKGKTKKEQIRIGQLKLIIARAHARMRQFSKIIPLAEPYVKKQFPDWMRRRAVYLLGRAYTECGKYKKGATFLHRYAEREPERKLSRWASHWAARLAMMDGSYKKARRYFWEYLNVYPDISRKKRHQVKWYRAWCSFRMGKYKKAAYALRALKRHTRSSRLKRRYNYWIGRSYERMGQWKKARKEYASLVRNTSLTYYGILAKQRLYQLEVFIRRSAQTQICQRHPVYSKYQLPVPPASSKKKKKRRKHRRKYKKRRKHRKHKPKQPELMRVAIKNPMWGQKWIAPWKDAWSMMMDLDTTPFAKAHQDEIMRKNVLATLKYGSKVVRFPALPRNCYRKNTRYCKRARRAEILAKLGFTKQAVDELFRGRWVMKRPKKRLIATIRWFRSVSAHHEALRMTYWLGRWSSTFKEKEYMSLRYPPAHASLLFRFTKNYQVPLAFAWGIMREESLFFHKTYSSAAARGLMQLIPKTAHRIAKILKLKAFTLTELYRPKRNIQMGCWYLGQLLHKFEWNIPLAAAAYNAGPHRVVSWLQKRHHLAADEFTEEIPFDETREYVRRVLRSYTVYNYLYKRFLPLATTTVAVRIKDNINF